MTTVRERLDSWINTVTGLGVALRDKRLGWGVYDPGRLVDSEVEHLVRGDGVARKICFKLPEAAFRSGLNLAVGPEREADTETAQATLARLEEVQGLQALEDAAGWARAFGGAVVVLGVDDGQSPDAPLDLTKKHRLEWLDVLDRREIDPIESFAHARRVEAAEHFRYVDPQDARDKDIALNRIHRSRLLFFPGAKTSRLQRARNSGWDDSVLQACWTALRDFQNDRQSASALMADASQGVFKIKNLFKMLGAQGKQQVADRIAMVDQSRSVARAILIDADEDFTRVATSFAGLPDMIRIGLLHVAAVSDTPVSVFWGQAPAGMDATGESDMRGWYDSAQAFQARIKPQVDQLVRVLLTENGAEPEDWSVSFCPLWQPSQAEELTARKAQAEIDWGYMDHGVVDSVEVAKSRFTARGFSFDTILDEDTRSVVAEAEEMDPEAPDQPEPGTPGEADPKPQAAALNGAQVQALQALAEAVATAALPLETAIQIALVSFPIDEAQAKAIFSPITPKEPPPVVPPEGTIVPKEGTDADPGAEGKGGPPPETPEPKPGAPGA